MSNGRYVSASVPLVNELCCMVGKLDIGEDDEKFHMPVYTSRKLVNRLPEVIAMPSKIKGQLFIITTRELFDTDNVQSTIAALDIQFLRYEKVKRELYKACLVYTISLKITPSWNAIGSDGFYIKGRDFLTSPSRRLDGVRLRVYVTDLETRLFVLPACINLPRLTLQHFALQPAIVTEFMESEDGVIDFGTEDRWKWVYILPSMKRGRVMKATKRIVQTSLIKTYEQLKEHWLNMYDYRLPETEDNMVYFQLWFPWADDGWCYPSHCLSPIPSVKFRVDNTRGTAGPFLDELLDNIPTVCGNELTFNTVP